MSAEPWGMKSCKTFLKKSHGVIREILLRKVEIREDEDITDDERPDAYRELVQQADVLFEDVKASFDKAIAALENEGLNPEEIEAAAKSSAPPRIAPASTAVPAMTVAPNPTPLLLLQTS